MYTCTINGHYITIHLIPVSWFNSWRPNEFWHNGHFWHNHPPFNPHIGGGQAPMVQRNISLHIVCKAQSWSIFYSACHHMDTNATGGTMWILKLISSNMIHPYIWANFFSGLLISYHNPGFSDSKKDSWLSSMYFPLHCHFSNKHTHCHLWQENTEAVMRIPAIISHLWTWLCLLGETMTIEMSYQSCE